MTTTNSLSGTEIVDISVSFDFVLRIVSIMSERMLQVYLVAVLIGTILFSGVEPHDPVANAPPVKRSCQKTMTFGWGDAVDEKSRCTVDPTGKPLSPMAMKLLSNTISAGRFVKIRARSDDTVPVNGTTRPREGRRLGLLGSEIYDQLLQKVKFVNHELPGPSAREDTCTAMIPESCCDVRTEVAYPQFGQSAITEETFTIIQDFPDFVQPVFKRICASTQCNLIYGNCTQKFVPHAVFSAPSGKFGSLFGQDYLLVESGCECAPAQRTSATSAAPVDPAKPMADVANLNRNSIAS